MLSVVVGSSPLLTIFCRKKMSGGAPGTPNPRKSAENGIPMETLKFRGLAYFDCFLTSDIGVPPFKFYDIFGALSSRSPPYYFVFGHETTTIWKL